MFFDALCRIEDFWKSQFKLQIEVSHAACSSSASSCAASSSQTALDQKRVEGVEQAAEKAAAKRASPAKECCREELAIVSPPYREAQSGGPSSRRRDALIFFDGDCLAPKLEQSPSAIKQFRPDECSPSGGPWRPQPAQDRPFCRVVAVGFIANRGHQSAGQFGCYARSQLGCAELAAPDVERAATITPYGTASAVAPLPATKESCGHEFDRPDGAGPAARSDIALAGELGYSTNDGSSFEVKADDSISDVANTAPEIVERRCASAPAELELLSCAQLQNMESFDTDDESERSCTPPLRPSGFQLLLESPIPFQATDASTILDEFAKEDEFQKGLSPKVPFRIRFEKVAEFPFAGDCEKDDEPPCSIDAEGTPVTFNPYEANLEQDIEPKCSIDAKGTQEVDPSNEINVASPEFVDKFSSASSRLIDALYDIEPSVCMQSEYERIHTAMMDCIAVGAMLYDISMYTRNRHLCIVTSDDIHAYLESRSELSARSRRIIKRRLEHLRDEGRFDEVHRVFLGIDDCDCGVDRRRRGRRRRV